MTAPTLARLLLAAGLLFSMLGLLAHLAASSAIDVVIDTRAAGAGLAAAGLACAAAAWFAGRRGRASTGRARVVAAIVFAVVVAGLFAQRVLTGPRSEEVRFGHDGIDLAGTLHVPRGAGPFPAVLMVHGAGSGRRDEYAFYARLFARHGVAGLAYDKRGTGKSTGARWQAGYEDLAADASAGMRLLKTRPEIDPRRVGIMGISEGEWVGSLALTAEQDAAFFVVVSPSGRSPADQVLYEVGAELRQRGYDDATVERAVALNRRLFDFVRTGADRERLAADLGAAAGEPWFRPAKLTDDIGTPDDWAWWRKVMDFDPLPVWSRVRCPVLLVSGGCDRKSPVEDSQARIRAALAGGGNGGVTARVFPAAEHGLIEWWLPGRLPPPRFAPGYLDLLLIWVHDHSAPGRQAGTRSQESPWTR